MDYCGRTDGLDEGLERIEETILPSLSMVLDTLLDAAALARPGVDAEVYAAELRAMAAQLETLGRELEAIAPPPPQLQRDARRA